MGPYEQLTAHLARHDVLSGILGTLSWDQQTYLPHGASDGRSAQVEAVSVLAHELLVDDRVVVWLEAATAEAEPGSLQAASCRNIQRAVLRARALPAELVARRARLSADGFLRWVQAREANDPASFLPLLGEIVELQREAAACIDPERPAYDVMIDAFDAGVRAADLQPMFERLGEGLRELIEAIEARPPVPLLDVEVPVELQLAWHRRIVEGLGYDLDHGRIDQAHHPFTVRTGPADVRITTRVVVDDLLSGLGSTVHEAGHALYEQGMPDRPGTMLGEAASLGMHESQSRFWENVIGRSRAFAGWACGLLTEVAGEELVDADTLWKAGLAVDRGLIRVDADEVTYNLHVLVRFELEQALVSGQLAVADLPDAWNDAYERHLGVRPPDARRGVLQDIHWSDGTFGYFPSYTLGNLYAASLGEALLAERPGLFDEVARGQFEGVLSWLRSNVHARGHEFDAPDLLRQVVGERDHVADLLGYLRGRYGEAYGL
jgi:carboxypeptidase Taq